MENIYQIIFFFFSLEFVAVDLYAGKCAKIMEENKLVSVKQRIKIK